MDMPSPDYQPSALTQVTQHLTMELVRPPYPSHQVRGYIDQALEGLGFHFVSQSRQPDRSVKINYFLGKGLDPMDLKVIEGRLQVFRSFCHFVLSGS